MDIYTDWLHGTQSLIAQWTLTGRGALKGTTPLHKGLFFTTSRKFALDSGQVHGTNANLYQATVVPGAHVLDITDPDVTCTPRESEHLRQLVVGRRPGMGNIQCEFKQHWKTGWRTGDIMKYAPRPGDEMMAKMADLAIHHRDTVAGQRAWNLCQMITRQCIEDIVDASIEAGYQAVAGNERQYGVTYPILIVLDPNILTTPVKI
ncbi:hypothetical protein [Pseudomonas viridiflava]|uniref:hypothetical protein n=1 Tax=Pseudomonas viridiflava TaxID=33069 RepID=UPI000F05A282|nr:hypothetical protein [Pseudomonas viridiflava]